MLALTRMLESAESLQALAGPGHDVLGAPTRQGVSEVYGLDRLGSQVFLDLFIPIGGTR